MKKQNYTNGIKVIKETTKDIMNQYVNTDSVNLKSFFYESFLTDITSHSLNDLKYDISAKKLISDVGKNYTSSELIDSIKGFTNGVILDFVKELKDKGMPENSEVSVISMMSNIIQVIILVNVEHNYDNLLSNVLRHLPHKVSDEDIMYAYWELYTLIQYTNEHGITKVSDPYYIVCANGGHEKLNKIVNLHLDMITKNKKLFTGFAETIVENDNTTMKQGYICLLYTSPSPRDS